MGPLFGEDMKNIPLVALAALLGFMVYQENKKVSQPIVQPAPIVIPVRPGPQPIVIPVQPEPRCPPNRPCPVPRRGDEYPAAQERPVLKWLVTPIRWAVTPLKWIKPKG